MPLPFRVGDLGASATRAVVVCWALLAGAVLVGLAVWQGHAYWEYSDGVYSLSARQVLQGEIPYHDFAAAQPPPLYYVGAAVLTVSDTPMAIRAAMALCAATTSLLVLLTVLRLTRWPAAALLAAVACLVTPWALREHAQLLPETLAAPVLMGAIITSSQRRRGAATGGLAALAVTLKLAFIMPALVIVFFARGRRSAAMTFAIAAIALTGSGLLVFGIPLWTNIVGAQVQTGRASIHQVFGLWMQGAWNLLPLLVPAGILWTAREAVMDPPLARSLLVGTCGCLLLLATLFKHGSYLTILVVIEPPLVCLAATSIALLLRRRAATTQGSRLPKMLLAGLAATLGIAQAASLLISPAHPAVFARPLSASEPGRGLSSSEVMARANRIRRCPQDSAYGGAPYLAFVAGRRAPGSQPDQFLIATAPALATFRARSAADTVCVFVNMRKTRHPPIRSREPGSD